LDHLPENKKHHHQHHYLVLQLQKFQLEILQNLLGKVVPHLHCNISYGDILL